MDNHAETVLAAIAARRSVRKYRPDMPPKAIIDRIIEAGLWAASGMGKQSSVIVAVTNRDLRDRLSRMNCAIGGWKPDFDPFYGAPAVLVVLADRHWENRVYDGSLVMGNLMLAAHALGLGSCWIHRAKEEFAGEEGRAILKELGIEGEYEGVGHCVLGYPEGKVPKGAARKPGRVFYAD